MSWSAPPPAPDATRGSELSSAERRLSAYVRSSAFRERGTIFTDLDGTAVHERRGRIEIPEGVERALKRLVELGRPLVLNTLRFPLSVLRTFGREWYRISGRALPLVSLNGSLLGRIVEHANGELAFEETFAAVLTASEIERALAPIELLLAEGIDEVLIFQYPRDWRVGEVIWTPRPDKVLAVKEKYTSASAVTAVEFAKFRDQLRAEETCMLYLSVDVPADRRMAYQHSQGDHFFTHGAVDKLAGAERMAEMLGIDLTEALGAGDTAMDTFLNGVGCAVIVGNAALGYRGLHETLHVEDSLALGRLLGRLVELHGERA